MPPHRKDDKRMGQLERLLRTETAMTLKWPARRLHMGNWTDGSNLLREKT